jgi:hypothetical protein
MKFESSNARNASVGLRLSPELPLAARRCPSLAGFPPEIIPWNRCGRRGMGQRRMFCFAAMVWWLADRGPWIGLGAASVAWVAVAIMTWNMRRRLRA